MINIGFYYRVKKGHEKEFEGRFWDVVSSNVEGMKSAKLYKNVMDPQEYMIYTEWTSLEAFRNFMKSQSYKETVDYGKSILDGIPTHRILQPIDEEMEKLSGSTI